MTNKSAYTYYFYIRPESHKKVFGIESQNTIIRLSSFYLQDYKEKKGKNFLMEYYSIETYDVINATVYYIPATDLDKLILEGEI